MTKSLFNEFCTILLDLLQAAVPLDTCLEIMCKTEKGKESVKKLSSYVNEQIHRGQSFSSAVSHNPFILIPANYTALFYSEEKTGSIIKSLEFIVKNEKHKKEGFSVMMRASVYPLLIISISTVGFACMRVLRVGFLNQRASVSNPYEIMVPFLYIAVCITLFVFASWAVFKERDSYMFLTAFTFFLDTGFDTYTALYSSCMQFKSGSRARQNILCCAELLNRGEKFSRAVSCLQFLETGFITRAAYFDETGKVVGAMKNELEREKNACVKRSALFLSLCEPVMIICTGVYLLLIIQLSVLPFITFAGGLV